MIETKDLPFNPEKPTVMHIDINSCFATVEQQFDHSLRGKPVGVSAREHEHGTLVAVSIEAKKFGLKTGMKAWEAKKIIPNLIIVPADPPKYRYIHKKMHKLLLDYTNHLAPKSIDEFVLHLKGYPAERIGIVETGKQIKERIKHEVGDWIRVSIGIGPNRFLAKTAAGLKKPDGLEEINLVNHIGIFSKLRLADLNGISRGNSLRLNQVGIFSALDFLLADYLQLKSAFRSVNAYYWYQKLRGWEIDDFETKRGSFSHSYVLPKPIETESELMRTLYKLSYKLGERMRQAEFSAHLISASIKYEKSSYWWDHRRTEEAIFDSADIYAEAWKILRKRPSQSVAIRKVSVACYALERNNHLQLDFFKDVEKKANLVKSVDSINKRWGPVIKPARLLDSDKIAPDAIAFGR